MSAAKKRKSSAPARKGKRKQPNRLKDRLADVSAGNVSLKDAADFAKTVWSYGKYALAFINAEEKNVYSSIYNGVVGGSAVSQVLFIAQGANYDDRIGDSIKLTNLRMDFVISANPTALQNFTRIVVLRDFSNTGGLPAISDVFQDTTTNALAVTSPYLHSLGDRFEVLFDEVFCSVYTSDSSLIHRRIGMAINDHVLWKGPTSNYSDTWQGQPIVLCVTDQGVNGPKVQLNILANFVDN